MTAARDAAIQAALDERDRLDIQLGDYIVGRIAHAALNTIDPPTVPEPCIVDCEGWDDE